MTFSNDSTSLQKTRDRIHVKLDRGRESMQWLLNLAEEYRSRLQEGLFYKALASASKPEDMSGWIRQLYYQSRDFSSALSLRHALCQDPLFQSCFTQHLMEEADHCERLVNWMRRYAFLAADENPASIPATLETLSVSAYCFRSILRESNAHQVIAMNLISEGVSYDFSSAVSLKLEALGLQLGDYWQAHRLDREHVTMGLDLIPQSEKDSPEGKVYARISWEMSSLYGQMLDSWGNISSHREAEYLSKQGDYSLPSQGIPLGK